MPPYSRLLPLALTVALSACTATSDGSIASSENLDTYCAAQSCIRDWTTAASACTSDEDEISNATCGGYDFIRFRGIDTSWTRYYAHASGQLVAIVFAGNGRLSCVSNSGSFTPPTGCGATACETLRSDAGDDASDAGGD